MKRYLAIDLGERRTGLAVGDDATGSAGPVGVIEARDEGQLLTQLRNAIDEYGPDELVIGIAYHMDDTLSPRARKAQALAMLLEQNTGLVVHRVDERLTSFEADQQMAQTGLTHDQKKQRRDALAAAAILRGFLARRRSDHS
jgi:putative Holliday junction resolvase